MSEVPFVVVAPVSVGPQASAEATLALSGRRAVTLEDALGDQGLVILSRTRYGLNGFSEVISPTNPLTYRFVFLVIKLS